MEIVRKSLDFIDDKDLQIVLEERLGELERVFTVNANLSTIILSISCIEGIFKHIATIFKQLIAPYFPLRKDGTKKNFDDLKIEELYNLLVERGILYKIENFDQIYTLFRDYRNFIHPQRQKKESWPVGLGQAQMALGLLNATIDQLSNYIFIGTEILATISGRPRFDLFKVLHLDMSNTRTHSFTLLKRKIDSDLRLAYDVDLGQGAVLNFVFNFVDDGNFNMLRLDSRENTRTPNALLHSRQKYHWNIVYEADSKQPPTGVFGVEISISFTNKEFKFVVDGASYKFFDAKNKEIDLFSELKKGFQIGWFNEEVPVKLSNIEIK